MKKRLLVTKWRVGDLIRDRYEVYDLKAGGIGIVYIVYDHENGAPYAIKTLQDRHLSNPMAAESFIREAEVWVRLGRHRNIVHALCVDQIDDRPYIFLECILGSSLKEVIAEAPLARRTVLRYGIEFCRGMIHAQKKIPNFAHLDIKPQNCLLTQDNTLKVTDFSLCRALFGPDSEIGAGLRTGFSDLSKGEGVIGTLPYMAPERFIDFGRADIRSDIYAFGVLLYEMLTGKRPLVAETPSLWRDMHEKVTPVEPQVVVSTVARELSDLIMRCLAKDPTDRPESFTAIMNDFQTMLWREFHEEIPLPNPGQVESWEYSNMGVSLCNLGRVREAISCFDKALSANPGDVHALLNKGVALGALGKATEELRCYEKALALDSEYTEAWYNKGSALYKLGRFEDAISCYDRALTINPHQAEVWVNRGSALGVLGRFEQELSCYDKAIVIDPKHARAWIGKAAALMHLGLFEQANVCCDRALAVGPGIAEAWVNKGSALGALERFDEAIRCCEKALAIAPRLYEAWLCKGLALFNQVRLKEAIFCCERALEIDPSRAGAWLYKGLALHKLGQSPEGDRCIQEAVALDRTIAERETQT